MTAATAAGRAVAIELAIEATELETLKATAWMRAPRARISKERAAKLEAIYKLTEYRALADLDDATHFVGYDGKRYEIGGRRDKARALLRSWFQLARELALTTGRIETIVALRKRHARKGARFYGRTMSSSSYSEAAEVVAGVDALGVLYLWGRSGHCSLVGLAMLHDDPDAKMREACAQALERYRANAPKWAAPMISALAVPHRRAQSLRAFKDAYEGKRTKRRGELAKVFKDRGETLQKAHKRLDELARAAELEARKAERDEAACAAAEELVARLEALAAAAKAVHVDLGAERRELLPPAPAVVAKLEELAARELEEPVASLELEAKSDAPAPIEPEAKPRPDAEFLVSLVRPQTEYASRADLGWLFNSADPRVEVERGAKKAALRATSSSHAPSARVASLRAKAAAARAQGAEAEAQAIEAMLERHLAATAHEDLVARVVVIGGAVLTPEELEALDELEGEAAHAESRARQLRGRARRRLDKGPKADANKRPSCVDEAIKIIHKDSGQLLYEEICKRISGLSSLKTAANDGAGEAHGTGAGDDEPPS